MKGKNWSRRFLRDYGVKSQRAVAQTNRLPFDRLRPNGGVLKSQDVSIRAELVEA
jgi:hypothetical protein